MPRPVTAHRPSRDPRPPSPWPQPRRGRAPLADRAARPRRDPRRTDQGRQPPVRGGHGPGSRRAVPAPGSLGRRASGRRRQHGFRYRRSAGCPRAPSRHVSWPPSPPVSAPGSGPLRPCLHARPVRLGLTWRGLQRFARHLAAIGPVVRPESEQREGHATSPADTSAPRLLNHGCPRVGRSGTQGGCRAGTAVTYCGRSCSFLGAASKSGRRAPFRCAPLRMQEPHTRTMGVHLQASGTAASQPLVTHAFAAVRISKCVTSKRSTSAMTVPPAWAASALTRLAASSDARRATSLSHRVTVSTLPF
ncbi:hypothetical protein JD79_04263 [Geodermatophilus normandii]|uniref:Uncharacterized protein n=1 Tax=Geodermatophilus normandii TaxID=1137989 RepID=A0A317QPP1_9ACTN|nr:hypothetical protein JD79_04263 [Geodermatophilus normandii]